MGRPPYPLLAISAFCCYNFAIQRIVSTDVLSSTGRHCRRGRQEFALALHGSDQLLIRRQTGTRMVSWREKCMHVCPPYHVSLSSARQQHCRLTNVSRSKREQLHSDDGMCCHINDVSPVPHHHHIDDEIKTIEERKIQEWDYH